MFQREVAVRRSEILLKRPYTMRSFRIAPQQEGVEVASAM
jgi:hypothetical protein